MSDDESILGRLRMFGKFCKLFYKIILLMAVEDSVWLVTGRYTNWSLWIVVPVLLAVATLFTYWMVKH